MTTATSNHGALSSGTNAFPTPSEAQKIKDSEKQAHRAGKSALKQPPRTGTSPLPSRVTTIDPETAKTLKEVAHKALNRGPEAAEVALKLINSLLSPEDTFEMTEDPITKLKVEAYEALPANLRNGADNNVAGLTKKALSDETSYTAVVQYLSVHGQFDELVRFISQLSDNKLSPEKVASLEDQVFATLQKMDNRLMMKGLLKILRMYESRTKTFVHSYSEHVKPEFGGPEAVIQRLIRLQNVYNKSRKCLMLAVKDLNEKDKELAQRSSAEVVNTDFRVLALQTGTSVKYYEDKGNLYKNETGIRQLARDDLLKDVSAAENQMKLFVQQLDLYIDTVSSKSVVTQTTFQDLALTAEFISGRVNSRLNEVNDTLSSIRQDCNLSILNYYSNPTPKPLNDEEITKLFETVLLEFTPLQRKMRETRKNPPLLKGKEQGKDKELKPLLDKIAYYREMRNFLVDQIAGVHQRLLDSQSRLEKMASQPPLSSEELLRYSQRTERDTGALSEEDKQVEKKTNEAKVFLEKHQVTWKKILEQLKETDLQDDYLISTYNNGGKDPRNKTIGMVQSPNTLLPDGVKLPEKRVLAEKPV